MTINKVANGKKNYVIIKTVEESRSKPLSVGNYPAELIYLNFQPLEAVSRYRDPQPQVVENYSYLFNLRSNISKY